MKRVVPALFAAIATVVCAGCAAVANEEADLPANVSSARQCFFVRQVSDYSEAPDGPNHRDRIYVRTGARDRYLLETLPGCPGLNWSWRIALDPKFQSTLCTGDTADLIVPSGVGGGADRCMVRVLGKVSEPR